MDDRIEPLAGPLDPGAQRLVDAAIAAAAPGPVCHPEAGTVSTRGPSGTESMTHTGASVWSSRRSQPSRR